MNEPSDNIRFSREERLLHRLLLHGADVAGNAGLLHGMTGFAVTLASWSRARRLRRIEDEAGMLIDKVFSGVTDVTPPGLGYGLAGIGWGMEYLIQHGFVKGSGARILLNLDRQLMQTDVARLTDESLERGLEGIMHYVAAHLRGARIQGEAVFDSRYLESLVNRAAASRNPGIMALAECIRGERDYTMDPLRFVNAGRIRGRRADDVRDLSLAEGVAGELLLLIKEKGGKDA